MNVAPRILVADDDDGLRQLMRYVFCAAKALK